MLSNTATTESRAQSFVAPRAIPTACAVPTCEGPPSPTTGLAGLEAANLALLNKHRVGLLIGGLARQIWTNNTALSDFADHKDVDVMVLDRKMKPGEDELVRMGQFEAGIDWWQKSGDRYTNAMGVELAFTARSMPRFSPGLYMPNITVLNVIAESEGREAPYSRHPSSPYLQPYIFLPRLTSREIHVTAVETK